MSALEQGGAFHHTSSSLSRRFSAVQNNSPRLRLHTNTSLFTPEPSPVLSPNTPRRAAPFVPKRRVKPKHLAGASLVLLALALFFLTSLSPPPALAPSWPLAGFFSDRSHAEDIQNSFPDSVEEPHRDTLVLYRILGNDLPPRHAANQTLQNLDFLLRNELPFLNATDLSQTAQSPFRRIDKYFILNRITAAKTVAAIRRLLLDYGVDEDHMLEIPFEWEEYEQRSFRWDGGVADASDVWGLPVTSDLGAARYLSLELSNKTLLQVMDEPLNDTSGRANRKRKKAEIMARLRALDYTFHDKNLYAINNNGGRNFALNHGRTLPHARWILPLDGNCFFTPPALHSVISTILSHGEGELPKNYITIPMTRLLDNDVVTASNSLDAISDSNFEPYSTTEEPQVGFRWTSQEIFQEAMRYGRRSKLEFLWRLGAVPRSRNLDQRTLPWETSDRSYLTADSFASIHSDDKAAQFAPAGWVYRLFSGDRHQEVTSASANSLRNMNRIKGIVSYLESLDEQLSRGKVCSSGLVSQSCGFRQSSTFVWDLLYLRQLRAGVRNDSTDALERLLQLALDIEHRPINSTDDIETMATSAATQAILAYLTDDFELAQKTAEAIFEALLPTPRVLLHQTEIAASRVSTEAVISLDGEGYSFPVLPPSRRLESRLPLWTILIHPDADLTQVHMPFSPLTFDPSILLDALRLLDTMHHHMPNRALHSLFSVQLAYLLQARTVLETKNLPLDEARAYDLKVASLAAYLDDVRLLNRIRDRAHLRSSDHQADPELLTRLGHVGLGEEALGDTHVVWDGLIDGRR